MDLEPISTDQPLAASFGLTRDAQGQLVLIDSEGVRHLGATAVRAFPFTDPNHWISIRDAEGRELACVEDIGGLAPQTRQALEEDLARREFAPVIQRILKVSLGAEPSEWKVETDRGPTQFVVGGEDDVRRLGADKALIIDIHGIRYLIPSVRALDTFSRRALERYI